MASLFATSWAPSTTVHFGSLEFVVTSKQTLVYVEPSTHQLLPALGLAIAAMPQRWLETTATTSDSCDEQLWRHLYTFLRVTPFRDDLHDVLFAFANIQGQLAGGKPLPPELLEKDPPTSYPRCIHNAAHTM